MTSILLPFRRRAAWCLSLCLLSLVGLLPWMPAAAQAEAGGTEASVPAVAAPEMQEPPPLGARGHKPWAAGPGWFVLLVLAMPMALWTGCAWKRAFDTEPTRLRREGIHKLRRLLESQAGTAQEPRAFLHAWRSAALQTWQLPRAAPSAAELSEAVSVTAGDAGVAAQWRELWQAAEAALFSADARLPADWLARARTAATAIVVPPRKHPLPNRRHHWLPALAVLVLALGASLPVMAADMPAHEQALAALTQHHDDWAAHHQLALHYSDEQDWNVAMAHALAAFQLGGDRALTRANLRYTLAQTAMSDPMLKRILLGGMLERLPSLFSAAGWQRLALIAAVLSGIGLSLLILSLYQRRRIAWRLAAAAMALCGLLVLSTAVHSWHAWGDLRRPEAGVMLQAVNLLPEPSDLAPLEETVPVAAGVTVRLQRSFLGWQQLAAADGRGGWVRSSMVLPIYAPAMTQDAAAVP